MLDEATNAKYLGIIKRNQTLKADAQDALEVITGDPELSVKIDQTKAIYEQTKRLSVVKGKIIVKRAYYGGKNNPNATDILYWAPCNLDDIFRVAGLRDTKTYYDRIEREDQVSFFGKDIKKAVMNATELDEIGEEFKKNYIDTDHAIADNIFYTIFFRKNRETGKIEAKCSRNTELSPRPVHKEEVTEK